MLQLPKSMTLLGGVLKVYGGCQNLLLATVNIQLYMDYINEISLPKYVKGYIV